ncbi:MAG TPA: single-stranded DNA-binding protein [Patescibacteria group bacterium]|nr:single-stranded DNA-binding protein [Patescibacteria group bacterium]
MDLNKAMIIGNVTRDPEVRTTPTGQTVANFGIATNFTWTDQQGQRQEKVEFHNIVAWRRLAEICQQYLKKGSKIFIEGRLETRSWDDQATGKKQYRTEIITENMIMLDRAGSHPSTPPQAGGFTPQPPPPQEHGSDGQVTEEEINIEDIPF